MMLLCMHKICHYRALYKMLSSTQNEEEIAWKQGTLLQSCTLFLPCPVCQHDFSDSAEASSYEDTQPHSDPLLFFSAYRTSFRSSISGAVDSRQSGQMFTGLDSHQSGQTVTIDSRQLDRCSLQTVSVWTDICYRQSSFWTDVHCRQSSVWTDIHWSRA